MSRIGRKIIQIPESVTVSYSNGTVSVKGPKGSLQKTIGKQVTVKIENNEIKVLPVVDDPNIKAFHGLYRNIINNMIRGVTEGFTKTLNIVGVGYKAELKGKELVLNLGYSHPINYHLPEGITCQIEDKQTTVILSGIDRELVGQVSSKIRSMKLPEPYKGKGVRYKDEVIKKKVGKAGATATQG